MTDTVKTPKKQNTFSFRRALVSVLKTILLVVIVLAVVAFFAKDYVLGTPVDTYPVIQTELHQTIVASGRISSPQRISIAAEVSGRVSEVPVNVGQQVVRGQVLILLDDESERASVTQARASVALAEAKLRQQREVSLPTAQQNLRQIQADVELARQILIRTNKLYRQNYISQAEVESAQHDLNVANSRLDSAKLQVEANQSNGSARLLAVTELNQANASLKLAEIKLAKTKVLAVADGTLISRNIEAGDMATIGQELMSLAVQGDTLIELQIDEKNLSKLKLGQTALCSADAFQQQQFNAEVIFINPSIDATRGAVEVKLKVMQPPAYLRQDMTVSIDIETSKKTDALVVPGAAIHDRGSDSPWVLVVRNHQAERQEVSLGLLGDENVEILTGLSEGERVIPANLALIKHGQRVRLLEP